MPFEVTCRVGRVGRVGHCTSKAQGGPGLCPVCSETLCVKLSTCTCEVVSAQRDLFSFTARLRVYQRDPEEVWGAAAPFDTPYSILFLSFHLFYC